MAEGNQRFGDDQNPGLFAVYGCFQKKGYPKMDGENHGRPYFLMDDFGIPLF